jgi:hypothetical protein
VKRFASPSGKSTDLGRLSKYLKTITMQHFQMEKTKSWKDFDAGDDMRALTLERELLAESLGVSSETLPPITETIQSKYKTMHFEVI